MQTAMMAMTNTTACRVMDAMFPMDSSPDAAIPLTMARTIIPRTSSMTAAAMMMRASLVSIRRRSLMILAVIPTDVATIAAARNRAWFMLPSYIMMMANPAMNGRMTPRIAQSSAGLPEPRRSFTFVSRPTVKSRNTTPSSAMAYIM